MKKFLLALLLFSGMAFAQTANPASTGPGGIAWPRATGAGAPVSPSPNLCHAQNYGQPYTDTTNNNQYVCSASGWVRVNGTGSGLSGQTTNCAPKAASATTSTSSLPVCDDGTTTTMSHPTQFTGTGTNGQAVFPEGSSATPLAGTQALQATTSGHVLHLYSNGVDEGAICSASNAACPSGGAPGGSTTQVQFNDSSAFGGSSKFTFNKTSGATAISTSNVDANGAAMNVICPSVTTPNDPGGSLMGISCHNFSPTITYPGFNYGSPGDVGISGWFTSAGVSSTLNDWSAGIHTLYNTPHWQVTGPGDITGITFNAFARQAAIVGSDEGFEAMHLNTDELPACTGTVNTGGGGAGATTLAINTSGCSYMGLSSPFIDTSTASTGTITYSSTLGDDTVALTTSGLTYTASLSGTTANDISVPRTVNNTTGQLSVATITTTLNTTTDLTTLGANPVCSIVGPKYAETIGNFGGVSIAFGTYNSGAHTQTVTAAFHFPHSAGATFYCGGAAGGYITYNTISTSYAENIYGSDSTHLIVGHQGVNTISSFASNSYFNSAKAATTYKGGEVVGLPDPQGGTGVIIEANNAPWANADNVSNLNNISASYTTLASTGSNNFGINNPYAPRVGWRTFINGTAGAWRPDNNWLIGATNFNSATLYRGAGGNFYTPSFEYLEGVWANGLAMDRAPMADAGQPVGTTCANAGGYMLAVCNGPAVGATSTNVGIFTEGDQGSYINYDHATGQFNVISENGSGPGLESNGHLLCWQDGTNCPSASSGFPITLGVSSVAASSTNASLQALGITGTSANGGDGRIVQLTGDSAFGSNEVQMSLYGYNYGGGAAGGGGQIEFHGVNANSILIDRGDGGRAGGLCIFCSLGTATSNALTVNGNTAGTSLSMAGGSTSAVATLSSTSAAGTILEILGTGTNVHTWGIQSGVGTSALAGDSQFLVGDFTTGVYGWAQKTTNTGAGYNEFPSLNVLCWSSSASVTTAACDSGLSRDAAGVVDVGDGTAGNTTGKLKFAQIIPTGTAPTIAAGTGAGTSPTISISGTNTSGVITLHTGSSPSSAATIGTITFNGTLTAAPQGCSVMPRVSGTPSAMAHLYTGAPSTTTWTLVDDDVALIAASDYSWSYICL